MITIQLVKPNLVPTPEMTSVAVVVTDNSTTPPTVTNENLALAGNVFIDNTSLVAFVQDYEGGLNSES
jgi:hypothetical protein